MHLHRRTHPPGHPLNYIEEFAHAISRSKLTPDLLPDGDAPMLFRVYPVPALAKGEQVVLKDIHDASAARMTGRNPRSPLARATARTPRGNPTLRLAVPRRHPRRRRNSQPRASKRAKRSESRPAGTRDAATEADRSNMRRGMPFPDTTRPPSQAAEDILFETTRDARDTFWLLTQIEAVAAGILTGHGPPGGPVEALDGSPRPHLCS